MWQAAPVWPPPGTSPPLLVVLAGLAGAASGAEPADAALASCTHVAAIASGFQPPIKSRIEAGISRAGAVATSPAGAVATCGTGQGGAHSVVAREAAALAAEAP